MQPIDFNRINTPALDLGTRAQLLLSIATVLQGNGVVTVALTYDKQTDTRARIAGKDYVGMPGVSNKAQIGKLSVFRYVNNAANRKLGRVGDIYLKVETSTRADGTTPVGYANLRPEGVTAFKILGFVPTVNQAPVSPLKAMVGPLSEGSNAKPEDLNGLPYRES